jgi:PAS domain S-box-containing protein
MLSSDVPTTPGVRVPLRVLMVEDSEDDAALALRELQRGGYEPTWERVDTAAALDEALPRQRWDVILCDYVMPQFSALAALDLLRQRGCDLPVIIVSGQVAEEVAAGAMKAGAHDYVSKNKLARLVPAVARELQDTEVRRARARDHEALRLSEWKYRTLAETLRDLIWALDTEGRISFCNGSIRDILGHAPEDWLGRSFAGLVHPEQAATHLRAFERVKAGEVLRGYEIDARHKEGTWVTLSTTGAVLPDEHGNIIGVTCSGHDVTERVRAEAALRKRNAELEERVRQHTGQLDAANKELEAFSLSVFHDLRAPLGVIQRSSDALLQEYGAKLDAEGRAYLDRIATATQGMEQLIQGLRSLPRAKSR